MFCASCYACDRSFVNGYREVVAESLSEQVRLKPKFLDLPNHESHVLVRIDYMGSAKLVAVPVDEILVRDEHFFRKDAQRISLVMSAKSMIGLIQRG